MGLLDKLVDKIIDSAKKKKQSASVKRAIKNNPALIDDIVLAAVSLEDPK